MTERLAATEASSGIVLVAAAIAALIWANLDESSYRAVFDAPIRVDLAGLHLNETVQSLINDGLMAIFFFVVGLEIKRELVAGELRDPRTAALPAVAALGGMVLPAFIYLLVAGSGGEVGRGWAIPIATDIAFAVGVLSLLGNRVSNGTKLFLLTLAIVDDIGAIAVIALVYTDDLSGAWLGVAVSGLAIVWLVGRVGIRSLAFYGPMAVLIWYATLKSGIHATVAGVALGLLTPASPRSQESTSPLARIEPRLEAWSSYGVIPIFALANAGIVFKGHSLQAMLSHRVALGVGLGLVVGKALGISLFTLAAIRLGIGQLPTGMSKSHLTGVAVVAGIGFTVSIFVTALAFTDPELVQAAKTGILVASVVAAVSGWLLIRGTYRRDPR